MIERTRDSGFVHVGSHIYDLSSPEKLHRILDFEEKHQQRCEEAQKEADETDCVIYIMGPGIYESKVNPHSNDASPAAKVLK
jgi:hypothetical protein